MPQSGYYRTGSKEAKARTARIKERRATAATPEGKEVTRKRLLAKKKTKEAGMTRQEKHSAERERLRQFELSRKEPAKGYRKPEKPKVERIIGFREGATRAIGLGPVYDALGKKKGRK